MNSNKYYIFKTIYIISIATSIIFLILTFAFSNYCIITKTHKIPLTCIYIPLTLFFTAISIIFVKLTLNQKNNNKTTQINKHILKTTTEKEQSKQKQSLNNYVNNYSTNNTNNNKNFLDTNGEKILKSYYNNIEENKIIDKKHKYKIKTQTITDNELYFLNIIKKHFGKDYDIRPQVPLSNIIEKEKHFSREYQNELNRIIDIGIFDKETTAPLLLIEINDSTHEQKQRKTRDNKVKNICKNAGIKLISFWLKYSNTEQYIVERISKYLSSNQDSED